MPSRAPRSGHASRPRPADWYTSQVSSLSSPSLGSCAATRAYASAITTWCAADATHRGRPLLPVVQMLLFFSWPVAAPIYLIASRGWKGVLLVLGHAVGLLIVFQVALSVALAFRVG